MVGHCRPSKFPIGSLTHDNINSLQFSLCVCVCVRDDVFLPKDENTDFIKESDFENESPQCGASDWMKMSSSRLLQLPVSVNGEAAADQWEGSREDATVIQEKTAHCSWDVGEV